MPSSYTITTSLPGQSGAIGPFVVPPNMDSTVPLQVWAPGVCTSPIGTGTLSVPPFALNPYTLGNFSAAQVIVDKAFAFSPIPATRTQMAGAFASFAGAMEFLEVPPAAGPKGWLLPTATPLVLNRVASNMLLRFDEVLPYYYNFNAQYQFVDLVPGMSLRVDWAGYQYCDGPAGAGFGFNSFVNSGSARFGLARRIDGTIAIDAFLGQFAGFTLNPPVSCPILAAGPIDLLMNSNARRHWRLIYPTVFTGAGNASNSGASGQMSCRLLGADTYLDIFAATTDVIGQGTGCRQQAAGNNPIVSVTFNGRVSIVPEIPITLNGNITLVPLGTTLRNVVQQLADPAPTQFGTALSSLNVQLARWAQLTGDPQNPNANVYRQVPFDFSTPVAPGPLGDAFDVPLVKGDSVTIGGALPAKS